MADYLQWLRNPGFSKRIWYVCGPERDLVEDVVDSVVASLDLGSWDVAYHRGDDSTADVLASLYQEPLEADRLVLVRDAEKLTCWSEILAWIGEMPGTTLILVTNEGNPRKGDNPEVFRTIAKVGRFIECRNMNAERMGEYVRHHLDVSKDQAGLLVSMCGSISRLVAEVSKLQLFEGSLSDQDIRRLVVRQRSDIYAQALLEGNSDLALLNIPEDVTACRAAIGLLRVNLEALVALISIRSLRLQAWQVQKRFNLSRIVMLRMWPLADQVTIPQAIRILSRVVMAQRRVAEGLQIGVMEVLALEVGDVFSG